MALRPRPTPNSIVSRNGSQILTLALDAGSWIGGFSQKGRIKSVVTPFPLAGFDPSESVATCMAGFAGDLRRQPGGLTPIPAAFRYAPAVSRRTPVSCSIRRSGQPSFPSAMTCCFFSSLKTLLMAARLSSPWLMSGASLLVGFQPAFIWPVLRWPHMAGFGWPPRRWSVLRRMAEERTSVAGVHTVNSMPMVRYFESRWMSRNEIVLRVLDTTGLSPQSSDLALLAIEGVLADCMRRDLYPALPWIGTFVRSSDDTEGAQVKSINFDFRLDELVREWC